MKDKILVVGELLSTTAVAQLIAASDAELSVVDALPEIPQPPPVQDLKLRDAILEGNCDLPATSIPPCPPHEWGQRRRRR